MLRGKSIGNLSRKTAPSASPSPSESDTLSDVITLTLPASTMTLSHMAKLRSSLTNWLTANYNEFIGTVTINVISLTEAGLARIRIEAKYRPSTVGQSGDNLISRRETFAQQIDYIMQQDLSISDYKS